MLEWIRFSERFSAFPPHCQIFGHLKDTIAEHVLEETGATEFKSTIIGSLASVVSCHIYVHKIRRRKAITVV